MTDEVFQILERARAGEDLSDQEKEILRRYRDSEGESGQPDYVDSMKQASGMTGIPESILKKIKADGCPAFKGSRVYLNLLNDWLEDRPLDTYADDAEGKDLIELQIAKERYRKLKLDNDTRADLLISRDEVKSVIYAIAKQINSILGRKLENELPVKLAGRSVQEIRAEMRIVRDEICVDFQEGVKEWA